MGRRVRRLRESGRRRGSAWRLCKPAIRRTAEPGDRLLAVTSRALEQREGYPAAAVIYAATVSEAVDAREYYAARSRFRTRPDCVYRFWPETGEIRHTGTTALHATADSVRKRPRAISGVSQRASAGL